MTELQPATSFANYCRQLKNEDLPGERGQNIMAPVPDRRNSVQHLNDTSIHHSAVLILCSMDTQPSLLYTLRNKILMHHGGQISFPGGKQETGESLVQTAQREALEEVGIQPDQYEITGQLSPLHIPVSGFVVHPWLAFCKDKPEVATQTSEVSEAFWLPLEELLEDRNIKTVHRVIRGKKMKIPYWDIHSVPLWGATAMITSEMARIYQSFLNHLHRAE